MPYTIPERTLKKWTKTHLTLACRSEGCLRFIFRYTGSTCSYSGIPIRSEITITLRPEEAGYRIVNAEIAFASGDEGFKSTCRHQMDGPDFIRSNIEQSGIVGSLLDEYLTRDLPVNPAGCFCAPDHVHHKWFMSLGTIAYYLKENPDGLAENL
ncbi:MAG: hypothetical protein IT210_23295 [Armatimonadetes bacterium]|nr:hypothetical protein [Armatimonadota bacterium]